MITEKHRVVYFIEDNSKEHTTAIADSKNLLLFYREGHTNYPSLMCTLGTEVIIDHDCQNQHRLIYYICLRGFSGHITRKLCDFENVSLRQTVFEYLIV